MEPLAAQIRALIHANASGLDSAVKTLPDAVLVAAGPAAIVLVLIIVALVAAIAGGGKKKPPRAEARPPLEEEPPAPVVRPTPPRAPPPPALDRRADALLEALAGARAPNLEPPSPVERNAQEGAAGRVTKDHAGAAKLILGGDVAGGFEKLVQDAQAQASHPNRAAQIWRDLGVLADGIDGARALSAFESAFQLDPSDFWCDLFLSRLRLKANRLEDALAAAEAAAAHAKGPREKAVAAAELGDANLHLRRVEPAREAYQSAIDMLRTLARSGERLSQRDLHIGLTKLGDLQSMLNEKEAALAQFEEALAISRHLARSDAQSSVAQRDLLISLAKRASVTRAKAHWAEARDCAEQLARAGRLPESDRPVLEALRKQAEAAT